MNDAGLLHATLATWALYGVLAQGLMDLRVDKLRHKNEAIQEVNRKIAAANGVISDELVGTVLALASFEVRLPISRPEFELMHYRTCWVRTTLLNYIWRH